MFASLFRRLCLAVAASLAIVPIAMAQDFPSRVIRLVNPYPAGGSVDATARLLAQKLGEVMKAEVIVESRSGAGGNVGADYVAKSKPDGYTLLYTAPGPLTVNQTLYHKGLPFNPERDFAPIALFATSPLVMMVNPQVPAHNVQDLVALAKKNPGKLTFASAGIGTTPHLSGELFKSLAHVDLLHVPYRGTGPAMRDLIAGHVDVMFDLLPTSLPLIEGGKVRALANAGAARARALPDLPTVAEQGVPGFSTSSWFGLVAPAKTPKPVVEKLIAEVKTAIAAPDMHARLIQLGLDPGTAFGKDFGAFMKDETQKWAKVIKESGAKVE